MTAWQHDSMAAVRLMPAMIRDSMAAVGLMLADPLP